MRSQATIHFGTDQDISLACMILLRTTILANNPERTAALWKWYQRLKGMAISVLIPIQKGTSNLSTVNYLKVRKVAMVMVQWISLLKVKKEMRRHVASRDNWSFLVWYVGRNSRLLGGCCIVGIGSAILASKIGLINWYVCCMFVCIFSFIAVLKLSVRRLIEDLKNFW